MRQCLDALLSGRGGLLLIAGDAGIGKTALVDWFADEVRSAGARFRKGQCYDLTQSPPYGPWHDALAGLNPTSGDALKHSPLAAGADLTTVTSQSSLFDRVLDTLQSAGARQPVAIALEDMHWSDPASLELLRFVARGIEESPLLLIATYRGDELAPNDPLSVLLPRLARESRVTRIDLGALDAEATRKLVRQRYALSDADEARLVAHLQLRTEGNAFYITEMLQTLEADRLLAPAAEGWALGALARSPVPPLIRQTIEDRLLRLDSATLHLLEIAADIGQEASLDTWQDASDASRDAVIAAAERAVAARLAQASSLPERLCFTHGLVRDTLYSRQPLLTRQARHRRIAETLAAQAGASPAIVASHFTLADDPRAIEWLIRAGEHALALYAARDAIAALDRAHECATRLSRPLPAAAYRARAAAATLLGDFDHARRDYELALEQGRATGDRHAAWQALIDLGMLWSERDYERTIDSYQAALALAREIDDPVSIAYSLNRVANWHVNRDEPDSGVPLHEEALALFETAGDRAGMADTLDFLGTASYLDANFSRAVQYCEQAIILLRERGDQQRLSTCLAMLGSIGGDASWIATPPFREPGYWLWACEEGLAIAHTIGWTAGEAFANTCLSVTSLSRGDLGRALHTAETALVQAREIGHQQWIVAGRQAVAAVWIELLDAGRAMGELEQALTVARLSGSRFWTRTIAAMLVSRHVAAGDLSHAAAMLESVASPAPGYRTLSQRQCRFAQAELQLAQGDPAAVLDMVDELLDSGVGPSPVHRLPLLLKLRGDALARIGRAGEAEQAYLTAQGDASILEYRPQLWRIEAALTALYLARGSLDQAAEARRRAWAIIEGMANTIADEGVRQGFRDRAAAHLPVLPSSTGVQGEALLSPRELDVLRHLVDGKSDREIAAALFISPRTVMRHVTGILNKLNVPSRTAAATLAVREKLV